MRFEWRWRWPTWVEYVWGFGVGIVLLVVINLEPRLVAQGLRHVRNWAGSRQ
jgi:hypothetical protein